MEGRGINELIDALITEHQANCCRRGRNVTLTAATRTIAATRHALTECSSKPASIARRRRTAAYRRSARHRPHRINDEWRSRRRSGRNESDRGAGAAAAQARAIARILGRKEFWSLTLDVTPTCWCRGRRPKPSSKPADFVVRGGLRMERLRILDIGTGSGALLLALLSELPNALAPLPISVHLLWRLRAPMRAPWLGDPLQFRQLRYRARRERPVRLIVSNPLMSRRRYCRPRAGGARP